MALMPNPLGDIVGPIGRLETQIEALGEELAPVAPLLVELLEEVRGLRADLAAGK